jgi:hypothetical protein
MHERGGRREVCAGVGEAAHRVAVDAKQIVAPAGGHEPAGMDHGVAAGEVTPPGVYVLERAGHDLHAVASQVAGAVRRPHQAADGAAVGEEPIDEMPADEAGAASEEHGAHGRWGAGMQE